MNITCLNIYDIYIIQYIFMKLKGATNEEVVEEALLYLKMMDIEMNADDKVAVLSKAMRRKLSLTIALMGKADVRFLGFW